MSKGNAMARDSSIVGVGCTKFGSVLETPEIEGMGTQDWWSRQPGRPWRMPG